MNNKTIIIGVAVLVLIVLAGGGYFALSSKKAAPAQPTEAPVQAQEAMVLTLTPSDLGLTLTSTSDNKKVIMGLANTSDIASIDYELSYTSKGNIPRGVLGNIDVKAKGTAIKKEILLGTCSDVCHYDQDVSSVKLVLKVTKTDDKIYSVEKILDF